MSQEPKTEQVTEGSVWVMVFPKSAFPQEDIDRIKKDFENAGAKLILAMFNNNATHKPEFVRVKGMVDYADE